MASPSRSPSPAAAPPIPLTPGPRATALTAAFTNALSRTLKTMSYPAFCACFPTPAAQAPGILKSVHGQITAKIDESSKREFEDIMQERDVVRGLNELERLVGEAGRRREMGVLEGPGEAPHTLPPTRLYLAHLAPYLAETEIELQAELKQLQAENEHLAQGLQGQKGEVERLVEGLETVVRDLEGANEVMDGVVENGDMRKDLREMEEEIRGQGKEREMKL
ncbi:MAG: hypothetical protein Q9195_001038 [Heterodermia aff. obscurata]